MGERLSLSGPAWTFRTARVLSWEAPWRCSTREMDGEETCQSHTDKESFESWLCSWEAENTFQDHKRNLGRMK